MKMISGISLVLETGEEMNFAISDFKDVGIYDIVEIVKQIGESIVEFKQAGSIYIEIARTGNRAYSAFGIGEKTTVFDRLLEDEDIQIAKILKWYKDGSVEEIYSPDDEIQEIYIENDTLCVDIYTSDLSDQEAEYE